MTDVNSKIILYYKFCAVADPASVCLWQQELTRRLQLKGRIIVARQGINGTLGGTVKALQAYKRAMNTLPVFKDIAYKWSAGSSADFPKLSVKVRDELVSLKPATLFDPQQAGTGLTPKQWHAYLEQHPEVIVLDARNDYESELGYFDVPNLQKAPIKTFRDIKQVVQQLPKSQPILTYCTGDVRCEYLSAYMKSVGFKTVHHLDGGIMKYGQTYGDNGFWKGKCYVFDRRMQLGFSAQAVDLAHCLACHKATSDQVNCDDCNRQLVVCATCQKSFKHCRSAVVNRAQRCPI